MKGLITAGGRGTRLRPITYTINKHLIPIGGKPMIFYAIERLASAGIKEIFININEGEKEVQKVVGNGSRWGVRITYFEQKGGALGLADVVRQAKPFIGDSNFVFYLGDNIILSNINSFIKEFKTKKLNCMLALARVKDPRHFGVPVIEGGRIIKVIEKPLDPPTQYAVCGIYVYDKTIFKAVENLKPSKRGEFEISDAHSWLIDNGFNVGYKKITGWWKDTGMADDLLEANRMLLSNMHQKIEGEIDDSVLIQGKASVGRGSKIQGSSVIRGPVFIGEDCVIKDAYIGPFTTIGNRVELYSAEVEHSLIFDDSDIQVRTRIVDSIIGSNSSIFPSKKSVPLGNKLFIGSNSFVEL